MPSLQSERLLASSNDREGTLYFLIKNPKKQELKLVLRNKSHKAIQAEFEIVRDPIMNALYDVQVYPPIAYYTAGGLGTVNLILKAKSTEHSSKTQMRCLVISKVKNSTVKFCYPCIFQFPLSDSGAGEGE